VLAGLVGGVINAWLFLLRVPSMTEAAADDINGAADDIDVA
jgi:hypothetical protein